MFAVDTLSLSLLLAVGFCLGWIFYRYNSSSVLLNIAGPTSSSFWKGNIGQFLDKRGWEFHVSVAQDYGSVARMMGPLGTPILYVSDPKALQSILVKDQPVYQEASQLLAANRLYFGPSVLAAEGEYHRKLRRMLNPAFSTNHIRYMTPIFYDVVHKVKHSIAYQVRNAPGEVDVLSWTSRAALELIGQGGLGHSFDAITGPSSTPYQDALKAFFPMYGKLTLFHVVLPYVAELGSATFRRHVVNLIPHRSVQMMKGFVDMLYQKSVEILDEKKTAFRDGDAVVRQQVGEGRDIMSILLRANMAAAEREKLTEEELIAQITTFIEAATDTTSTMLARMLNLLASNPQLQRRLRHEIVAAHDGHDLPFDKVMKLPLLDAVCRETLRLYPASNLLGRETQSDIVLPLSQPIRGLDGSAMYEIPIPKGTNILIGVLGSNTNKALWGADALEWKPERWLTPIAKAVGETAIPGVFPNLMTFNGGPRGCIGYKFAELEMKVFLSVLLSAFSFELTGKPTVWNVGPVMYPTVGEDSDQPELPLRVTLLNRDDIPQLYS